jgi:hypothetical protein
VYQELMALLGANPGYFTPNSMPARLLSLLFAITRYLFGGLFLAIIVRSWASDRPNAA